MNFIRPLEEVPIFYNFLMGWEEGRPKEWYCGIEGISFIWHGDWGDPEIGYKGYAINEPTATDGLYDFFHEETGSDDIDGFAIWLKENCHLLFDNLDDIIFDYENNKDIKH